MVEALKSAVQLNKLQGFMNVDDTAILRSKNLTLDDKLEAAEFALDKMH